MAGLPFYNPPGFGALSYKNLHYAQVIRVGERLVLAGQGGWDPLQPDLPSGGKLQIPDSVSDEIDQAFRNVDRNLRFAGAKDGWGHVYKVLTLSTNIPEQHESIVRNLKHWMPKHAPTWTEAGISHLGAKEMRFEIEVEAWDPEGAREEEEKRKEKT